MSEDELRKYKLNNKKSLEVLKKYGIIDGGGRYSVEYAFGNFIYFSPVDSSFIKCGGFYRDIDEDYENLLKDKIKQLIDNKIIVRK